MPFLNEASSKWARAAVYRVIRHAIVDAESAALFRQHGLDWYLVRYAANFPCSHGELSLTMLTLPTFDDFN